MKQISLNALPTFLNRLAETASVIAPIEQAGQVDFGLWDGNQPIRLDVLKTVKSAKGAFFPQVEDMVRFHMQGKSITVQPADVMNEDFVLFGVRACDAKSFELLDRVFLSDPVDPFYAARRKHGVVMTLACNEPEESCFCTNFDIDASNPAGDVTCWIVGDRLLMRSNTEKGEKLLVGLDDAEENAVSDTQSAIRTILNRLPLANLNLNGLDGAHLMERFEDPCWEELSKGCLGCGTCTFVCPTCQCYDIRDFDTGNGVQRYRCWDSCMFSDFTLMAHGTNRPSQKERFRQRFMHKLVYFPAKNEGLYSCVGCGRCLTKCPQAINIVKVINALGVPEDV